VRLKWLSQEHDTMPPAKPKPLDPELQALTMGLPLLPREGGVQVLCEKKCTHQMDKRRVEKLKEKH